MKQLKIEEKFWEGIKKGYKKVEFRKLSKGIASGYYEIVSVDSKTIIKRAKAGYWFDMKVPVKKYGVVKLEVINVNGEIYPETPNEPAMLELRIGWVIIGRWTYNFVKNNYIDKDIDYVAYRITFVKEYKDE